MNKSEEGVGAPDNAITNTYTMVLGLKCSVHPNEQHKHGKMELIGMPLEMGVFR
jgi:hypothetical protein